MATKKYEVTWLDTGLTKILTLSDCNKLFGKDEFTEIVLGYLPHIVAIEL